MMLRLFQLLMIVILILFVSIFIYHSIVYAIDTSERNVKIRKSFGENYDIKCY